MSGSILPIGLACLLATGLSAATVTAQPAEAGPLIEIAILLDNSGSMQGLIDQARARLWSIVNDLARTGKDGRSPDLRVALYEYGNSTDQKQWQPLTADLDVISQGVFGISIGGNGEEYCGQIILKAVEELDWQEGDHYRAIFIAGNEPFTQGPVDHATACKAAATRGIVVNTIHCGPASEGQSTGWVAGARLADGESLNIDQDRQEVAIAAPQDARIGELNTALNATYLAYGAQGRQRIELQAEQDANSVASSPSSFSARALSKCSVQYANGAWELCDAVRDQQVDLASLPDEQLPEELRGLDAEQRAAYVAEKTAERGRIQRELATVVTEREAWLATERARLGEAVDDDFGAAVRSALRGQLSAKGYQMLEQVELGVAE